MDKVDIVCSDLVSESEEALRAYVDIKAKLHADRYQIEEQKDEITEKILALDTNIKILDQRNKQIETTLKAQEDLGNTSALTTDSLDKIITIQDPFSTKIVHLVAKYNALEDCMAAVKKGFEKDAINL